MTAPDPSTPTAGPRGPASGLVGDLCARLARRPLAALAILTALLAVAAVGLSLEAPRDQFQRGELWEEADRARAEFGMEGFDPGFVAVVGPVLEPRFGEALRGLEAEVEATAGVRDLVTPWELVPGFGEGPGALEAAAEHPAVRDAVVVRGQADGRDGLLLPLAVEPGSNPWAAAGAAARGALEGDAAQELEVHVTGLAAIIEAQAEAFQGERVRFLVIGTLLGFLLASYSFRSVRATFLAGLPPLLGVFVSVGWARFLGLGADGFTTIVLPLLVLTIGFTDSLHIVVEAVRERAALGAEGTRAGAMEAAVGRLGGACALTSLTTAIGFGSMAVSGNALIVDFGLSCALGTAMTFVCVVAISPLLARTGLGRALEDAHLTAHLSDEHTLNAPAAPTRALLAVMERTLGAPRTVALIGVLATAAFAWLSLGLEADRRAMVDLAEGSDAQRALAAVDAELGGVFPLFVRVDWSEGTGLAEATALVGQAAAVLEAEPVVSGVFGVHRLAEALGGGAAGRAALALALATEEGAGRAAPFVDASERRALIHARVPDAGSQALLGAFGGIREGLAFLEQQVPGVRMQLVGDHVAYMDTVDEVTGDLRRSLALAALLILVTLSLAMGSWRLGLASIVPNLLPLGVAAAMLSLGDGAIDVSTLTALTLSLGIATDDTIHVLHRWRLERGRGLPLRTAARLSVVHTLPALAATTLTLTAAFGQLLTSELPTIRAFGLVAMTTILAAFLCDVWLLPAVLVCLARRGPAGAGRSGKLPRP